MNMPATSTIRDVSDTAIWVAYYRAVETDRPDAIIRDPLAKVLVGERGAAIASAFARTGRYTAWSVIARTVIIDEYIQNALKEGVDAVVNLGAGLDTRPYRMDLPASLPWIEADFPHMVHFKEEKLRDQVPRCQLQRVGVDLSDNEARLEFLANVAPGAKRILVLTEGVIPYLTEGQVSDLARDLRARPQVALWVVEYFSEISYRYMKKFATTGQMANAPFQFFPSNWMEFFAQRGWQQQEIHFFGEIARRFRRTPPMPWIARLVLAAMSKERVEQMHKLSGYLLLSRRDSATP
jgi:methyltransferase (TIGR00027 family)